MAKEEKYREETLMSEKDEIGSVAEESVVRKQGMTINQCRDIINCFDGVSATSTNTDETDVEKFRDTVKMALNDPEKHVKCRKSFSLKKTILLFR